VTSWLTFKSSDGPHCTNGDDGILCSTSFGSAISVLSLTVSLHEKCCPEINVGALVAYQDVNLTFHKRITLQPAPTIPIAHHHNPAVSYLEGC